MANSGTPSEQIVDKHGNLVMICVDESDNAEHAFTFFLNQIRRSDSTVILFHCSSDAPIPSFVAGGGVGFMPENFTAAYKEIEQRIQKLKEKYEKLCEDAGLHNSKFETERRAPHHQGEAIVEAAKQDKFDFIVMGSRGMGVVRRTFLGSVSDYVLHHSPVPVVIVPPENKH